VKKRNSNEPWVRNDLLVVVWHAKRARLLDRFRARSGQDVANILDGTQLTGVQTGHGLINVQEIVVLHAADSSHAGVNARGEDVLNAVGVDVASAESERWETRVDVIYPIVMVGDAKFASVFVSVAVRVTDQRALPVVVYLVPGYRHEIASVCDVNQTIEVILTAFETN